MACAAHPERRRRVVHRPQRQRSGWNALSGKLSTIKVEFWPGHVLLIQMEVFERLTGCIASIDLNKN